MQFPYIISLLLLVTHQMLLPMHSEVPHNWNSNVDAFALEGLPFLKANLSSSLVDPPILKSSSSWPLVWDLLSPSLVEMSSEALSCANHVCCTLLPRWLVYSYMIVCLLHHKEWNNNLSKLYFHLLYVSKTVYVDASILTCSKSLVTPYSHNYLSQSTIHKFFLQCRN